MDNNVNGPQNFNQMNNGPQNFNQMNSGPQNFNNQSYVPPQQQSNKPKNSGLGIAALILSILGCTFVIAIILAIIDLTKKDGKNKILSKVALGISGFWLLIGIIGSIGNKNNKNTDTAVTTEVSSEELTEEITEVSSESSEEVSSDDKTALQDKIKDEKSLVWFGDVRNDNTGKWRYSMYSANDSQETFAADYYKAFFENDDEIHAVINTTNKTTAKVSVVGSQLDVTIHEYVEDEEHDANALFGGSVLKQYLVNISDGSIEEISDGTESSEEYTEDNADIVLVAGELGEYGRVITLNADTDMPDDRYLYKIPAGKYKVITTWSKMTSFGIVNDNNEKAIDPDTNYEYMPHVGDDYSLTAGEDDFNGHAEKEVVITLGEDESIWLPYTKESIETPGSIKFLFFVQ